MSNPLSPHDKIKDSLTYAVPFELRNLELYPKVAEMLDYIICNAVDELVDVESKFTAPQILSEETIKQIIEEKGYAYIRDVMETLDNFEFNVLLSFISVINLLKGSRSGLELILRLLGFDSIVTEWWEADPKGVPHTYELTVIINTSFVQDIFLTLEKVQIFAENYVFPTVSNVEFRFALSFAEKNVNFAGFTKPVYSGSVLQRIP